MICDYSEGMCPYLPVALSIRCDECMVKKAYKRGFYELPRPYGECNQCRHYEGVHGVYGHAPCSFWGIGGVLSSDYCSRFEKEGETE